MPKEKGKKKDENRSKSVIQPSANSEFNREDSLKLPDIRQMMREMDEKLLHKKVF